MRNKKMKRSLKLLLVGFLACGSLLTAVNTKAASGYIYDSKGQPIESSVGLIANEDSTYNINSTAWKGYIKADEITNMQDMFVYSTEEKTTEDDVVYVVDATSNNLFVFDGTMKFKEKISKFEIDPTEFTVEELSTFRTGTYDSSKKTTTSSLLGTNEFWKKYDEVLEIPYDQRTEDQKFYISLFGVSGVYRAIRPEKDDKGAQTGNYQDLIYLCDTSNAQIVIVDSATYKVVDVVPAPAKADFASKFAPVKMVTDSSGRMYIISSGIYEGIILMNEKGDFMRYVGVNYTTLSFWDAFLRNFKTEEQLAAEVSILATIFNNLTIDKKGFLYTVSSGVKNASTGVTDYTMMVKRINQAGNDVLIRNGYALPQGDLVTIKTGANAGGSNFAAITVNEYGVYTIIDKKMNRLFTYDNEGNLLYISGGSGIEQTDLANPVAVCYQGENVLVLDQKNCAVLRYEPTNFAKSINNATKYQFNGDSVAASNEWKNVITANSSYQLAYVGVGKTLLEEERYLEAMLYFEKGDDVAYYARAYKKYRDGQIEKYFPAALGCALVLVGGVLAYKLVKKFKNKSGEEGDIV